MSVQLNDTVARLLNKFRFGEITPAEFQDLRKRMDDTSDAALKHFVGSEWENFENYPPLSKEKIETLYEGMNICPVKVRPRFMLKRYWIQTAVSLLLIIAGSLTVLTYMQRNEINALAEQNVMICSGDYGKSLVTLPDGTLVHLNAKSSLTYSQDFGRYDRKVELSGEGFFEVKKDSGKKFMVGTGYMCITVLGTKFNVYAYETKDIVEMSLVEGSVNITTTHPPYQSIRVKPNEKVVYNKHTRELKHESTSNKMETAWMNRELVFRSEQLKEVFRCLSRKFAVTFSVDDDSLLNDVYTGTFDDENIESIMHILKCHYNFDYDYVREKGLITIQTRK